MVKLSQAVFVALVAGLFLSGLVVGVAVGVSLPRRSPSATPAVQAGPTKPGVQRSQLKKFGEGWEPQDIVASIGPPDRKVDAGAGSVVWVYDWLSIDEATGKRDRSVTFTFASSSGRTQVGGGIERLVNCIAVSFQVGD